MTSNDNTIVVIDKLFGQNTKLFDYVFGLVKIITEQNDKLVGLIQEQNNKLTELLQQQQKKEGCGCHKKSESVVKSLLNEDGVFDPFKGMDEEMKKGFASALKHAPDIVSVIKKEQEKEEERDREWKEKLGR